MSNRFREVCYQFQNSGYCSFGDRCRYSHEESPYDHWESGSEGSEGHSEAESEESVEICRHFQKFRTCKYGDNCRYSHDVGPDTCNSRMEPEDEVALYSSTPIDDFFAQYFWFSFNPTRPVYEEFYRMCRESQWNKQEKLEIKACFKDVLVVQFNQFYGTDVSKLSSWQLLCRYIGLYPIPGNIDGCKALIQNTHVNIVDLVDAGRIYGEVTIFDTVEELREYSLKTGKIFPRENAKAGGVLRYLLRKIDVGPGMGSRGHSNI
ncbi:hypothetical protein ABKN59_007824 [Abortiporus biennis]